MTVDPSDYVDDGPGGIGFLVQDDEGSVYGANAYVDVVYLRNYHATRGNAALLSQATEQQLEAAIVLATGYIDGRFQFIGWRQQVQRQTTAWPRFDAVDNDGAYLSGVPLEVKDACSEYAARALPGILASPWANTLNPDPAVTTTETGAPLLESSVKVGPIEETFRYLGGAAYRFPPYPFADMIMRRRGLVLTGHSLVRA